MLALVIIGISVILPLSVHAGFFDAFFDTVSAKSPDSVEYANTDSAQGVPLLRAFLNTDSDPGTGGGDILVEDGALVPNGDGSGEESSVNIKTSNGEINLYVVREADTLSQIALMYDVSAKTILWANNITNPEKIRPGDTLVILPITGVRHVVKAGDTVASIAKKYSESGATSQDIADTIEEVIAYNQLASAQDITVGDTIVIPDGTIAPPPSPSPSRTSGAIATGAGSSGFVNPLPGSVKTQGIHGYNGVDLSGVSIGSPVVAASGGEVIVAKSSGWNGGYGSYVVVKHPNGTQTLYAHLSSVSVVPGQAVTKGQKIGGMGNTGRSTGPHLHFEVRGARNPF